MDISEKERKRHIKAFALAQKLASGFFSRKFAFTYDSLKDIPQPYLVLANHNLNLDPVLVGIASGNQLYYVASEHITHNKFLYSLLKRYLHPIIHVKGSFGMRSAMEIMKTLRSGYNVGMFPEGNRSFDGVTGEIPEVTGRLAKKSGAGLVTFRIEGGYLTQPRWGDSIRKGKTFGRLVHYYSPEELKGMSEDEVQKAIETDLHEDAYERQAEWMVPYKGKKLARYMESTLFVCPKCGHTLLASDSHRLYCTDRKECGFEAKYDKYGYLTEKDGTRHTVRELNEMQKETLAQWAASSEYKEKELFSDNVTLYRVDGHTRTEVGLFSLIAYSDCFVIFPLTLKVRNWDEGEKTVYPDDIKGMAIYTRNHLVVDLGETDRHYEIDRDKSFNALKYLYLYRIMKNKEEN